jgi:hypothetical protein
MVSTTSRTTEPNHQQPSTSVNRWIAMAAEPYEFEFVPLRSALLIIDTQRPGRNLWMGFKLGQTSGRAETPASAVEPFDKRRPCHPKLKPL